MKINMWLIAEKLKKYDPVCDIKNGDSTIEGLRFMTEDNIADSDMRYVYLSADDEKTALSGSPVHTTLIHGEDIIMIRQQYIDDIINDILKIFDYYNDWENSLWNLAAAGSFQEIIDKGTEALGNPMILAETSGAVLAMSSVYRNEDINPYWVECRETGQLPTSVLGMPVRNTKGQMTRWTSSPDIYYLPDGTKQIGQIIFTDGEPAAGIASWQTNAELTPGHCHLMKTISDVLAKTAATGRSILPQLRSGASILADLLDGVEIDDRLLSKLELRCCGPWRLISINNPYMGNIVSKQNLISRMEASRIACVPLIYKDNVLCLITEKEAAALISKIFGSEERKYYCITLSMTFYDLADLQLRYLQQEYAREKNGSAPGLHYAEKHGLSYMLSLISKNTGPALAHPGLKILADHDEQTGSDLYDSLYYYLYYDQSLQKGAAAVHVHRNSFLYRINKIKTLLETDLTDPEERRYLLFSYMYIRSILE